MAGQLWTGPHAARTHFTVLICTLRKGLDAQLYVEFLPIKRKETTQTHKQVAFGETGPLLVMREGGGVRPREDLTSQVKLGRPSHEKVWGRESTAWSQPQLREPQPRTQPSRPGATVHPVPTLHKRLHGGRPKQ